MQTIWQQRCVRFMAITLLVLGATAMKVSAQEDPDQLKFTMYPNLWLPTIEGEIRYTTLPNGSSGSPQVSVEPGDWLESFDFGLVLTSELRKGRKSLFSDFMYMKLSSSDSQIKAINFGGTVVTTALDIGTEVELEEFLATVAGGYTVVKNERFSADLIAGVRYLWLESDLGYNLSATVTGPLGGGQTFARTGEVKQNDDLWNGIGGVRGRINVGDGNWFIPYYADIGAGDSKLTWQAFSGLGYVFGSWDMMVGYRRLTFEGKDDDLAEELTMAGPIIGAAIRF